jgi:Fic family protein
MQIVSGLPGRETVHYEAPPSHHVSREMDRFLDWFAATAPLHGKEAVIDGLTRAAIAHLWFETIHPFEDGNGRLGRAIVDMALAQDQGRPERLYSLSGQLLAARSDYYDALNRAQCGDGDVTVWVCWFAGQLAGACAGAGAVIDRAIAKNRFWTRHAQALLLDRQRKVLQRLLDAGDGGFLGGLSAEKYIKMTGVSKATATRDLGQLVERGLLWAAGEGKARRYYLEMPGWTHGLER